MATTEIAEKEKEQMEIEIYPTAELFSATSRMLKKVTPIKIAMVSSQGDVVFTVTLDDLGISAKAFNLHPFFRSDLWANYLGELLIRQNLSTAFNEIITNKNYEALVKKYNHKTIGLRQVKNNVLLFQFHMSLLYRLINEMLAMELTDELSKNNIISSGQKIKREDDTLTITSYPDGNNIRLIVPKTNDIRLCFQKAISTILEFFGIKNKETFITTNMFNYEIEIKNANG